MKKTIALTLIILPFNLLFAQILTPFYSQKEAAKSIYANNISSNENFSADDINNSFSNIDNLIFLKDAATLNRVILVGETHYATNIQNLRNRILFAINTYDYYPLIIVEFPYSTVEYFNYYIHLENDAEANSFLSNELTQMITTEEDFTFLNHLRRWNKTHKDKPISIGGTDLEFAFNNAIEKILLPYFYEIDGVDKEDIQRKLSLGNKLNDHFFSEVELLMEKAEKENTVGKYPFISVQYINNIIKNLRDTHNAYSNNFNHTRQNSIIGKLTSDAYFGEILKKQKVMLHGGGEHMKSRFRDNPGFLSEGIYLNHTFPETKGKVYSIMIECFAYSLGDMRNRKIEDCIQQGKQYRDMLSKLHSGYKKGEVEVTTPYFIYSEKNSFLKQISIYYYHNQSVSFTESQIQKKCENKTFSDSKTREFLKKQSKKMIWYDKYIFIPASKMITARLKE